MSRISGHRFLLLCSIAAVADATDATSVNGAGSTFVAPLMTKWIDAFCQDHSEIHIDYQATGSGAGIKDLFDQSVAFAASDAPLSDAQLKDKSAILHLPAVAGPEVLVYNQQEMPAGLILDGPTIAGIFLGTITQWDDPSIKKLNPGIGLPTRDIVTVHRSDGSGTTWIFSNYLSKVSPDWSTKAGCGTLIRWPCGIGGRGNEGVAQAVQLASGSIGYVELAFAAEHHMVYAKLVNHDGNTVEASLDGVREAVRNTTEGIPDDLRLSITDAPGKASYPICGFSYFLVYQDLAYVKDASVASQAIQFIEWCEHSGQGMAAPNYIPVSPDMQHRVEEKMKTIVFEGKSLVAK